MEFGRQRAGQSLELDRDSPYMMLVAPAKQDRRLQPSEEENKAFGLDRLNQLRSDLPAITHVDYSARIQTVDGKENPRMHKLLDTFKPGPATVSWSTPASTSATSPLVRTPDDAYRCFMGTQMDILTVENAALFKERQ